MTLLNDAHAVYIGDTALTSVYAGDVKVWPSRPPLPGFLPPNTISWYDAADDATFTYSSGTVVAEWLDKGGYNKHLVQPVVASQPNRNATQNGLPCIAFDGIDDFLHAANVFPSWPAAGNTMIVVAKITGTVAGQRSPISASTARIFRMDPTGNIAAFGGVIVDSAIPWGTEVHVVACRFSDIGQLGGVSVDGSLWSAGNSGIGGMEPDLWVGQGEGSSEWWQGVVCEAIVCEGPITDSDMATTATYLMDKWFPPVVSEVLPAIAHVGWTPAVLTVVGSRFDVSTQITYDGTPLVTTFISETALRADVDLTAETPRDAIVSVVGADVVNTLPWTLITAPSTPPTTGLLAWWDAEDATLAFDPATAFVAEWRDKGPNDYHGVQTVDQNMPGREVADGRLGVDFRHHSGSGNLPSPCPSDVKPVTYVVVTSTTVSAGENNPIFGGQAAGGIVLGTDGANKIWLNVNNSNVLGSTTALLANARTLITMTYSDVGEAFMYFDGIPAGAATNNQTPVAGSLTQLGNVTVGGWAWTGHIYEALKYDHVLSDAERSGVESYLANRWGIPLPPPVIAQIVPDAIALDDTPTEVWVHGTYFEDGDQVTIGGVAVPTVFASASLLKATVDPAGQTAGPVDLAVTNLLRDVSLYNVMSFEYLAPFDFAAALPWVYCWWAEGTNFEAQALGLGGINDIAAPPVALVPAEIGTLDFTQTDPTKQGVLARDDLLNYRPAWRAEGTQLMLSPNPATALVQPFTFVIISAALDGNTTGSPFGQGWPTTRVDFAPVDWKAFTGSVGASLGPWSVDTSHVSLVVFNAAASEAQLDDGPTIPATTLNANSIVTTVPLSLLSWYNNTPQIPFAGHLAFVGVIAGDVRAQPGWVDFHNALTYWGVPVTYLPPNPIAHWDAADNASFTIAPWEIPLAPVAHWDASDASTLTTDGSGLVSEWRSKIGSFPLAQADPAKQPTHTVDRVTFDGARWLQFIGSTGVDVASATVIAVFSETVEVTDAGVLSAYNVGNDYNDPASFSIGTGTVAGWIGAARKHVSLSAAAGGPGPAPWGIGAARFMADGQLQPWWNGQYGGDAHLSTPPYGVAAGGWLVGARFIGNAVTGPYLNGDIGEIIVYDRELTDVEINEITSGLAQKWAVPGITPPGQIVSEWRDQINGVALTQADPGRRPTLIAATHNGLPTVMFNGDFLHWDGDTGLDTSTVTVMLVAVNTTDVEEVGFFCAHGVAGYDYDNNGVAMHGGTTAQSALSFARGSTTGLLGTPGTAGISGGGAKLAWNLYIGLAHPDGTMDLWANNWNYAGAVSTGPWGVADGGYIAGTRFWNGAIDPTKALIGEIGEILVFDRILSDEDREIWETKLKTKWGFPTLLDTIKDAVADADLIRPTEDEGEI